MSNAVEYVIVEYVEGHIRVLPATIEGAMVIFNDYAPYIQSEIIDLSKMDINTTQRITLEVLQRCVTEYLIGDSNKANNLRRINYGPSPNRDAEDSRPMVEFDVEAQNQLKVWLFDQCTTANIKNNMAGINIYQMYEAVNTLIMFSVLRDKLSHTGKTLHVVQYGDYLDASYEYDIIVNGRWKVDADPTSVCKRITRFVMEYVATRSATIEVVKIQYQ